MSVPVNEVIADVSLILQDIGNVRWKIPELLSWLNHGQREVVLYKPNACVTNKDVVLVAGSKQALPDGGNSLVDIPRNTDGNAITLANRSLLDQQMPDWHSVAKRNAKVIHYCYSASDPKNFYIYPPSPGGNSVEIIYNSNPANAVVGANISIDDIYASALVDYIAYRAFSKDSELTQNEQTAGVHYQAFVAAIKGKAGAEATSNPNARSKGNPNAA
jgi:hypothetical protein